MATPLFRKDESVILRSTLEMGRIESDPQLEGGEYWYRVRFVKRCEQVVEDDLEAVSPSDDTLESLVLSGRWGRLQAVRCALGIERIRHTNRSTIYAFQSQRILFEPYQYKPLLKVLDSPDRRVVIADEVGLGKTIEAGLILTELIARGRLERVLVVCPSRLREKWRNELNGKFDQDFNILDKQSFLQAASNAQENPARFRLRGIISMQSMRGEQVRESLAAELGHVDMVIVDEAHHARNRQTATSELLRDLCEVADCVLLLTATPLHLKNEDLFTLVNALRPAEFRDAYVFDSQLDRHAPVHVASALARTQQPGKLHEIATLLKQVFCSSRNTAQHDPKAIQVIEDIQHAPPSSRREWVELERQIQELHPLGSIVTRTRKRDVVENAPERRARTCCCNWTSAEEQAYQRLVEGSGPLGWIRSGMSFGQIQRARQAASCLPAAFQAHATVTADDEAVELTDILPGDIQAPLDNRPHGRPIEGWSGPDSKLEMVKKILRDIRDEEPDAKVLVFTFFRGTARYLEDRLNREGWPTLRIDGDVVSDPRRPDIDERGKRIYRFESDPNIKVLVSTEVGSEGLDFQFCHHLVNYDLPWNPMVVEQRIGRIDRFGQESRVVHIHNLVVHGTVEDTILNRLYARIGIFERSIGNLESILGRTMSELQRDFVRDQPQERRYGHSRAAGFQAFRPRGIHPRRNESSASSRSLRK
jgi:SNF2 family DNA or RNA helicase